MKMNLEEFDKRFFDATGFRLYSYAPLVDNHGDYFVELGFYDSEDRIHYITCDFINDNWFSEENLENAIGEVLSKRKKMNLELAEKMFKEIKENSETDYDTICCKLDDCKLIIEFLLDEKHKWDNYILAINDKIIEIYMRLKNE